MNPTHGVVLAIDQSTSATKAMLFSTNGSLLDHESLQHDQIYPQAGWVEHDADVIYRHTLKTAIALLDRHADIINDLLAVSITNQRETFVIFDRETGEPLYNAIVWQCRRGDDICQQLIAVGCEPLIHELTGLKIDTYFPASKLRWLLDNHPDIEKRLKNGSALFGTIDTYLIYRLTGGKVYATDHTNASRTLLFDIGNLNWSPELIDVFRFEFPSLPEVRESSAWFGDTLLEGYLKRSFPIYGVMGDSQAALFAQKCFEPGSAKVTFGTGSSILLNIGHEKRLSKSGTLTALGWVLNGEPTYAFEGLVNYSGATITWLRDQMQLISDPSETEKLALSVRDTDGVHFVPAFVGLNAPYWRSDARAAILGMSPATTRAHIVRAALEAIAFVVTDTLNALSADSGFDLMEIQADGGAVRNTFLMQFVSDINQIKVKVARTPELSALGAVFSGLLGLKAFSSLEDLDSLSSDFNEFLPVMDEKRVSVILDGWHAAVSQVLFK